jgi:hypothetical protein
MSVCNATLYSAVTAWLTGSCPRWCRLTFRTMTQLLFSNALSLNARASTASVIWSSSSIQLISRGSMNQSLRSTCSHHWNSSPVPIHCARAMAFYQMHVVPQTFNALIAFKSGDCLLRSLFFIPYSKNCNSLLMEISILICTRYFSHKCVLHARWW